MPHALSVRAPWWWAILYAGKDIENRSWPSAYRGPILIHAGQWFRRQEVQDDLYLVQRTMIVSGNPLPEIATADSLRQYGGYIVGQAELVDCVTNSESPWFCGRYGFVLKNPRPLNPAIRYPGQLGLFKVPDLEQLQTFDGPGEDEPA